MLGRNWYTQKPGTYHIGEFFRYLTSYEPKDQGISLKAYEKKTVSFRTIDDKYLSYRGRQVSLRGGCQQTERFVTEVKNDRISFRTEDGAYLSASDNQIVLSRVARPGKNEKFRLVSAPRSSKYTSFLGVQTHMKTYFTYIQGQGILTHTKQYTESCLFYMETSEATELDTIVESVVDRKVFPENPDEMMARYEDQYVEIRPDSNVQDRLAMVMLMAKLETLAMSEAPNEDEKDQNPVFSKSFCVTVSSSTIQRLSSIIARTSVCYFDPEMAMIKTEGTMDDYVNEMYMLLSAMRILKVA